MIQLVENLLKHDGYKYLKLWSVAGDEIKLERLIPAYVLKYTPHYIEVQEKKDDVLGLITTEIIWPVLGRVNVLCDGKMNEYFMVHRSYGKSVSDCVRLAVEGSAIAKRTPAHGFVKRLPAGVEDGREVFGVAVHEAEWMTSDCVAVR